MAAPRRKLLIKLLSCAGLQLNTNRSNIQRYKDTALLPMSM